MICLDTSFLVDYLQGKNYALESVEGLWENYDQLAVSSIVMYELYSGAVRSEAKDDSIAQVRDALDWLTILDFDDETARKAAEIRRDLLENGDRIPVPDIMIAATSARHSVLLATVDADFNKIPRFKPHQITRDEDS